MACEIRMQTLAELLLDSVDTQDILNLINTKYPCYSDLTTENCVLFPYNTIAGYVPYSISNYQIYHCTHLVTLVTRINCDFLLIHLLLNVFQLCLTAFKYGAKPKAINSNKENAKKLPIHKQYVLTSSTY